MSVWLTKNTEINLEFTQLKEKLNAANEWHCTRIEIGNLFQKKILFLSQKIMQFFLDTWNLKKIIDRIFVVQKTSAQWGKNGQKREKRNDKNNIFETLCDINLIETKYIVEQHAVNAHA